MDSQPALRTESVSLSDTKFLGKLASVDLIPWDPDSSDHVERMIQQRVACGWKQDHVEAWRDYQRDGKLVFYWIVSTYTLASPCFNKHVDVIQAIPASHPAAASLVHQHLTEYPAQSAPLQNTATSSSETFHPIGHICLDGCAENHENDKLGISPADGIYTIGSFYVSGALQGIGIGGLAMSALERYCGLRFWCLDRA